MKKIYVIPTISTTLVETQEMLITMSTSEKEINENNAGLVKEDVGASRTDYNVWSDDWSK